MTFLHMTGMHVMKYSVLEDQLFYETSILFDHSIPVRTDLTVYCEKIGIHFSNSSEEPAGQTNNLQTANDFFMQPSI